MRSDQDDPGRTLGILLRRTRRRLAARRALERASRALPWALGLAAAVLLAHRLPSAPPFGLDDRAGAALALALAALVLAAAVASGLVAARWRPLEVAALVDRALRTDERVLTAAWLAREPDAPEWARRALAAVGDRGAREAVPLRPLPWRAAAAVAPALLLAALAPRLHARDDAPPPPDARVAAAATRLEQEAEAALERLEEREAPESARRAVEQVRQQARQIAKDPPSVEKAENDLRRLEQQVREQQDAREAAGARALERALGALEQSQLTRQAARAAQDGDVERLERELQALAERFREGVPFDARESRRLVVRLEEAADALREAGHGELADRLAELAAALKSGDMESAARIAGELAAAGGLEAVAGDAATDQALADARALVRQALAGMGRPMSDAEAAAARAGRAGRGAGEGAGEEGAAGEGPGSGSEDGGAPDWGVGTTNEAVAGGPTGSGRQRDRQSQETSDWREAYEALHESSRLEGAVGRASLVPGQVGLGEVTSVSVRTVPAAAGEPGAPVVAIPPSYAQAREEALARDQVPPGYVEPVRKYFNAIEGAAPPEPAQEP